MSIDAYKKIQKRWDSAARREKCTRKLLQKIVFRSGEGLDGSDDEEALHFPPDDTLGLKF